MTSDWGVPQFENPSNDNYATVETSGEASVEASYDPQGHVRPWKHTVIINVFGGALDEGDTITLTLGDRSEGSMGHRTQTFPEEGFRIAVLVDAFGTGEFVQLTEDLYFDVVPGTVELLKAVVPSTVSPNDAFSINVRGEDYWGNTATEYNGSLSIELASEDNECISERVTAENGLAETSIELEETGTHRFVIRDENNGLVTTTNPVRVTTDNGKGVFWGDIHGQSGETVGTGTIQEYFDYLRDNAFLDFASHAGNDFQITDEFWEEIQETIQNYHDSGKFVTFLCYEWSANTPRGGDHNVYFRDDEADIHRSSSWQIEDGLRKHRGTHPIEALYEHYQGQDDVMIIPHQGGRPSTLDVFDPDLSPFLEIVSVWGVFEWFGQEALERGYPVGFVGGSDDHTGRPGATYPTNQTDFNVKGGLMAVQADDLTRDSLWEAFNNRHCYATTGARILLDTQINGVKMGESVSVDKAPEIEVDVEGTAPLRRVDLFRGTEQVATQTFDDGDEAIEFTWSGARSRTRHKVQDWTGGLSVNRGRITNVDQFGFDHPEQGVTHRTDTSVRWDGSTSGNYQGIRVTFDVPPDATVSFATPPVETSFEFQEIDDSRVIDAGHLDQQLEIRSVGKSSQKGANLTLTDDPANPGTHPYYVRVSQVDGEMAWSSSIFVETT
jgi:hypothetical protein